MGLSNFLKSLFGAGAPSVAVTKECSKCHKTLYGSQFHRNNKTPDGLQYWCIHCRRSYDKSGAPTKAKKTDSARASCLSVEAAAERVGLSRSYFYKLMRRGEGPQVLRVGKRYIISEQALSEWVNSSKKGGE